MTEVKPTEPGERKRCHFLAGRSVPRRRPLGRSVPGGATWVRLLRPAEARRTDPQAEGPASGLGASGPWSEVRPAGASQSPRGGVAAAGSGSSHQEKSEAGYQDPSPSGERSGPGCTGKPRQKRP